MSTRATSLRFPLFASGPWKGDEPILAPSPSAGVEIVQAFAEAALAWTGAGPGDGSDSSGWKGERRLSSRADRGAREGRPRHSSIARIASGAWMAARIRIRPRQRGHSTTSTAHTRCISSAQYPASSFSLPRMRWEIQGLGDKLNQGFRSLRTGGTSVALKAQTATSTATPYPPAQRRYLRSGRTTMRTVPDCPG